jgi:5-methylcytosine-specific restriction endonuclease McrA
VKTCRKKPPEYFWVDVTCSDCGTQWKKWRNSLTRWGGKCRSCAQKFEKNKPESRQKASESSRKQVLRQGGIANCKRFGKEKIVEGSDHWHWRGGVTSEIQKLRTSVSALKWRKGVFVRDSYTCQLCGQIGGSLQAHHKKAWKTHEELRFDEENGVTLCKFCHLNIAHNGSFKNPPVDWDQIIFLMETL